MQRFAALIAVRAVALGLVCAGVAGAQETAPVPRPSPSPAAVPSPDALPDLEISADVTFEQLRFDVVGEPRVEFTGRPERHTLWEAERINLPRPVQAGVTYRNAGVRLRISSTFAELARLYQEEAQTPPPVPPERPRP